MKILLHTCCAPCTIVPLERLRGEGHQVRGFFTRQNIHPASECLKREECLREYAEKESLGLIFQKGYGMEGFLRGVAFREADRCLYCYHDRLTDAARVAKGGKFEAFTTTLLYSKFQKHEAIREIGLAVGRETGVPFLYRDFRDGWKEGIEKSKAMGLYRQGYCGCVFSEKERYWREAGDR